MTEKLNLPDLKDGPLPKCKTPSLAMYDRWVNENFRLLQDDKIYSNLRAQVSRQPATRRFRLI
ncbi:MAG: hypothetical protein O2923_01945 [Verrucomicrobia bacterium]|nr:hypothetical protein [Verrucomicrobiota bacterium]MDA1086825.1 hypothetical protein [Verrucomicrobiota bacterium]